MITFHINNTAEQCSPQADSPLTFGDGTNGLQEDENTTDSRQEAASYPDEELSHGCTVESLQTTSHDTLTVTCGNVQEDSKDDIIAASRDLQEMGACCAEILNE